MQIQPYVAHGDSMATATMIFKDLKDEENGNILRTGITSLAKGTSRFFTIFIAMISFYVSISTI